MSPSPVSNFFETASDFERLRERLPQLVNESVFWREVRLLLQETDRTVPVTHRTRLGVFLSRDEPEEGRFASPVRSDDADAVVLANDKRHVVEQLLRSVEHG